MRFETSEIQGVRKIAWLAACWYIAWFSAQARADASECGQAHIQAQVLSKRGDLLLAREQLLRCARADCPDLIVEDCAGWLPQMENRIPTVVFAVSDAEGHDVSEVTVTEQNGRLIAARAEGRAVELDPGMYVFRAEARGYQSRQERIIVRESEKARIVRFALQPIMSRELPAPAEPHATRSIPLASYILAGGALVGGGAFAYFGLRSNSLSSQFDDMRCGSGAGNERECADVARRGQLYSNVANVSLALGVASLSAAVVVYLLAPPSTPEVEAALTNVEFLPGGVMLNWRERF